MTEMFDIKENLKNLPDCPGVYMHKDKLGKIIYVGKAVSLKNRVRQYFQSSRNMAPKVRSMVSQIAEFEYITAGSEMEALILECNLIKKYRPKYNILLRDDKTYPYIKITNEEFPRVIKTRRMKKDGGKYYGPYSDVGAVNMIVDLLNDSFSLKRCSAQSFPKGFRPCLNYHINQCRGICSGSVDREKYAESVQGAREFLAGKNGKILAELKRKMAEASEELKFEEAARYRDYIEAAKSLSATQRVVMHQDTDIDIVIPAKGSEEVHIVVFFVREGKLTGRETYEMEPERAALVVPSMLIVHTFCGITNAKWISFSFSGLLDGVLWELAATQENKLQRMQSLEDILSYTKTIAKMFRCDMKHAQQVNEYALMLFDALSKAHGLNARHRLMLQIAVLLHDSGKFLNLNEHADHSAMIIHATEFTGISTEEKDMIAIMVRFHEGGEMSGQDMEFMGFGRKNRLVLAKLTGILRLANAMDYSHRRKLKNVKMSIHGGRLVISAIVQQDATLENWKIRQFAEYIQDVFGLQLEFNIKRGN